MKLNEQLQRQCTMLNVLAHLPRRILSLHGTENITEFVLHDLCHENCFNLTKVAYFVDNPDFNCTKGVAGFSRDDAVKSCDVVWSNPHTFSDQMKSSPFNQKIRSFSQCSLNAIRGGHEGIARELAQEFGFKNHTHCLWGSKHDNQGFVLYEKADESETFADDHIINGLSLLSFCPIF